METPEKAAQDKRILVTVGVIASIVVSGGLFACVYLLTTFIDSDEETAAAAATFTPAAVTEADPTAVTHELIAASDLIGSYAVEGTNPNGGAYQGTLEITQPGEYYDIEWVIAGEVITGTGLLQQNVLSVSWGGAGCVAQYYSLQADGSLIGVWFWVSRPDSLGTEYLAPLDDGSENLLVGTHDMTGVNPDGDSYEGTAEVTVNGSVYSITWYVDDEVLPATGVRQGDVISVGWGDDTCNIASYIVEEDGLKLNGIWTNVGEALLGTETGEKIGR